MADSDDTVRDAGVQGDHAGHGEARDGTVHKVLIVANETIGGGELEAAVRERVTSGRPTTFHLLVPIPPTPSAVAIGLAAAESAATAMVDLPDQRVIAEDRLEIGLDWLHRLGATATGQIGPTDSVAAAAAIVEQNRIDEVIVSTLPSRISRWLKQDLPCRIGRKISVPLTVVTASDRG